MNNMFVARYTKQLLIITALIFVVAGGIVATMGLKLGIDFTGGSLTEVSYDVLPEKIGLESEITEYGNEIDLGGFSLRETMEDDGRPGYILRTRDLTDEERQSLESILSDGGKGATLVRYTSIGPVIGEELKSKAVWAIGAVVLIIILYVAIAFSSVEKPVGGFVYGGITILALVHDVLVPTAVMSVLGYTVGVEADVLFVMAILAVLGYSVNDTIVVFDRVRENLLGNKERDVTESFETTVGRSVQQTLLRSINTSVTTLLALGALYYIGGEVTQTFALVLMVGVIAGTYSSIFIANPLLIYFGKRNIEKAKLEKAQEGK